MPDRSTPDGTALRRASRRRFLWCVVVSLAVHLWLVSATLWRSDSSGAPDGAGAGRINARLVDRADLIPLLTQESAGDPSQAATPPRAPDVASKPQGMAATDGQHVGMAGLPDTTFYPARQLDVYPRLLAPIQVQYPAAAAQSQVSGEALVMLMIDEYGGVNEVSVVQSMPAGYFEESALAAFASARFSPARKDGRIVRSRVLVNLKFNPDGPTIVP